MLDRQIREAQAARRIEPAEVDDGIGLPEVIAFAARRRNAILVGLGIGLALAVGYVFTTPPAYKATTSLLIDTRKLEIFGTGNVFEDAAINTATIESQVQVLLSGRIAEAVVQRLGLVDDAEFLNPPVGLVASVTSSIKGLTSLFIPEGTEPDATALADRQKRRAMAIIAKNLDVERVGLSYVLDISYTASDPTEAARIANGVTAAYLDDIVAAAAEQTKRTTVWLEGRLTELRSQAEAPSLSPQEKSAVRATYDNLMARYTQMLQQQSLQFTEARVITAAAPPTATSSAKSSLVLIGGVLFGAVLGLGIALTRELLDRYVRSAARLEAVTGVPCLGVLPSFAANNWALKRQAKRAATRTDAATQQFAAGAAYSMVLTAPSSRFAETLRGVTLAIESGFRSGPVHVVGVTSSLPGEGRTTVAVNLARLAAQGGRKVLLIDADLRNPALSQALVPKESPGILQIVEGMVEPDAAIWSDDATPLKFLPAGTGPDFSGSSEIIGSERMATVMSLLRPLYDMIVVDLPPASPVIDVRAAAHLFDGILYVVEWGAVEEEVVKSGLQMRGLDDKIVGTLLNKVNLDRLARYDATGLVMRSSNKYIKSYRYIQ